MRRTPKYIRRNAGIGNVDLVNNPDATVEIKDRDELEVFLIPYDYENENGNNRYKFLYPPEFKTLKDVHFKFGVRNIVLKFRNIPFEAMIYIMQNDTVTHDIISIDNKFVYMFKGNDTNDDLLLYLNKFVNESIDIYNYQHSKEPKKIFKSKLYITDTLQVRPYLFCNTKFYYIQIFYPNQYMKEYFQMPVSSEEEGCYLNECSLMPKEHNCLVRASFSNAISNNYIGITNTVYPMPKYYDIDTDDTEFYLELFDLFGNPIHERKYSFSSAMILMEVVLIRKK